MKKNIIRLAYRISIDSASVLTWDKYVFEDTYKEYLMQHQLFNTKEDPKKTFRELLSANEKAQQLHYLVGIAANSYVEQLKGKLYRVPDVLGNNHLPFTNYKLDIVNTDINDPSKHKIGITFYSPKMVLINTINNTFLLSDEIDEKESFNTFQIPFQPGLAICFYEIFKK